MARGDTPDSSPPAGGAPPNVSATPMNERTAIEQDVRRALAAEEGGGRWLRRLAVLGVVAALAGGGLVYRAKHRPALPARFVTATPSTGDVSEKVQATGAV